MNQYGNPIYKGSVNKGYASSWLKRLEEEEELRAQADMEAAEREASQRKEEEDKPLFEKAGRWLTDTAGAVGNVVKDAAVDLYDTGKSSVEGNLDVWQGSASTANDTDLTTQESSIVARNRLRLQELMGEDIDNPNSVKWDTPEVQEVIKQGNKELGDFRRSTVGERESNDRDVQESQNVDATKTAADTAETFLNLATLGTGTGLKTGGKQALKMGSEQLAKRGARDIAKAGARGAGEGAVFGAAAGLTDAVSEDVDSEDAVGNIARGALTGGLLGGASATVGGALDARRTNSSISPDNAIDDIDASEVADSLDNPLRDLSDEDLSRELTDIIDGKSRSGDIEADYRRVQELRDELNDREAGNYFANGGRSPEDIQTQLDELDAGTNLPDQAYRPAAPVTNIDDVISRPDIPIEIRNAAQEVAMDRRLVNEQMEGLMSPQVKADEISRLDEQYDIQIKDLTQRYSSLEQPTRAKDTSVDQRVSGQRMSGDYKSDVRFQIAKDRLDAEYEERIAELDLLEAQDFDEVQKYQGILDTLATREQNIVGDTRQLMAAAPDRFRDIDDVEVGAMRQGLESQLAEAKRFSDRKNIIEVNSQAPDPVRNVETKPEVREAVTQEAVEEISKIPSQFRSQDDSLIVMKAMSPSQWFQKRGLRGGADNAGENVHANIIKGLTAANKANVDDSKVIGNIQKMLPGNKELQRQIVEYIEGSRQTLSAAGDQKVAAEIQSFLNNKREQLTSLGLATRDDYFPHIWDKNDPVVRERFYDTATGEFNFNNVKARIAGAEDYSTDIINVLSQYTSGVNRKIHLEPAMKPLSDLKKQVEMTDAEAKYIDLYINQIKGLNRSDLERGVNKGLDDVFSKMGLTKGLVGSNHYTKVLSTQRMISAVASMGLNPGTIIRNGTQAVNTVADLGPRYSTIGAIDGARMLASKEGMDELKRVGVIDGGVSQNFTNLLEDATVKGRVTKGRDRAVWAMMAGIRGTDIVLRAQAYAGAKALAKAKGLTGEAAENFAINKVVDTQFMTSVADMPVAFNGQGVRSLTQLATFSGKQAGFLKRMGIKMVKGEDGKGFRMKDAGSVLAGIATAAMMTEALKPVIGFNEKEWVPFYDQIAPFISPITGDDASSGESLYRSPLIRLLMGDGKGKSGLLQAVQSIGKEVEGGEDGETNDLGDALNTFWDDNWSSIVPAGGQIKKSTEGYESASSGISRNDSDNIRFKQDQSGDSDVNSLAGFSIDPTLQASLFGQYSTQAGQNWIREGFPTLSEKQTAEVDNQNSPEAQRQYIDFYQARKRATGRQKAYDAVKDAAMSGDLNKAARLAAEFNDKVRKAMGAYYSKHDTLPQELRDELQSSLYINVNRVRENIEDE